MNERIQKLAQEAGLVLYASDSKMEEVEKFSDILLEDIISELDHYKFSVSDNEEENERFNEGFRMAIDIISATYEVKSA